MEALENNVPTNENNGNGDLFSSFHQEDLASAEDNDFQKINNESSDEDESTIGIPKRRRQRFSSNSETEIDKENIENQRIIDSNENISTNTDSENEDNVITKQHKSKILKMSSDESEEDSNKVTKLEHNNRVENKRSKLKDKFKHLHRNKENNLDSHKEIENKTDESFNDSSNEMFSLNKIKQKVKERRELLKMSICDPDTSDEEEKQQKQIPKHKRQRKSVKPTSPKPIKMSNKQAMENMQKIRSESNRMLREKDVSLPYHRPKAFSLKDIMSRRRPALTNEGKALPIKMNEDDLKKYALSLEQRQKEMLELCKSDTDDDDYPNNETLQSDGENVCTDSNKMPSDNDKAQDDNEHLLPDIRQMESINDNSQGVSEAISNDNKETHCDNENAQSVNEEVLTENYGLTESNGEAENSSIGTHKITTNDAVVNKEHSLNCSNNEELNDISESDMKLVYDESIEENENEITSKEDLGVTSNVSKDIIVTESDLTNTDAVNEEVVESNDIRNINKESDECDASKISKVADLSIKNVEEIQQQVENNSENDSQLLSLHFDTEDFDTLKDVTSMDVCENNVAKSKEVSVDLGVEKTKFDEFSDSDGEREDIDALIENAEILKTTDSVQELISPALVKDPQILKVKPRLSGQPNMLIDLSEDPSAPKKLSGLELLKQRFIYFENLKTSDEKEREREKRNIPGIQHLRLKEELAEKIAEQRSLEWTKRLQEEKQQQTELNDFEDEAMEEEDEIEKIKKQNANDDVAEDNTASEEEIEYDVTEKSRKYNPLIEDEADESDCEDKHEDTDVCNDEIMKDVNDDEDETKDDNEMIESDDDDEEDSSEESSESEQEEQSKPKKGRILKAFEDSDDEEINQASENIPNNGDINLNSENNEAMTNSQEFTESQVSDDTIQLGQVQKSFSDDLFTSQDSVSTVSNKINYNANDGGNPLSDEKDLETFSNLNYGCTDTRQDKDNIRDISFYVGSTYDGVTGICNETFSQSFVPTQIDNTPQSQEIGEDVFALCTGKFYDNQFVSQMGDPDENGGTNAEESTQNSQNIEIGFKDLGEKSETNTEEPTQNSQNNKIGFKDLDETGETNTDEPKQNSQNIEIGFKQTDKTNESPDIAIKDTIVEENVKNNKEAHQESTQSKTLDSINNCDVLKDILEELKEVAELPKPKYFDITDTKQKVNCQFKKKFIIDSDDDDAENHGATEPKKKKFKKRKPEKRALQFSDDEDDDIDEYEEVEQDSGDEVASEADNNRLVEYDSEENEIEVNPRDVKKKRKTTEFFEKEAELTSEDEWVGSGDEDEAGLDRMEREEGDDDVFHQGELQKELGQIHCRDMLDQDKRDVRLIQEVLFEDGDLGVGSRQRKYRWRDVGDEEESGAIPDEFGSQEADFESEEQWRKQRHEREVFLRSMRAEEKEDTSLIIKGSICNKSVSSLVLEVNSNTEIQSRIVDKRTVNTSIFKQSYHGSFLSRGNSALSRLAAIASPLAMDDDDGPRASVAPTNKRNFVFTSITPKEDKAKIAKRKADDHNIGTPKLLKKMKADENVQRTSLFDHLKM